MEIEYPSGNYAYELFTNSVTGKVQSEDPRLGPLPPSWGRRDDIDPATGDPGATVFLKEQTGEEVTADPRLTPE